MSKTLMRLSLPVLAIALLGIVASSAGAQIFVGRGVENVRLGDSENRARQLLGDPFREAGGQLVYAKPCLCTLRFRHGALRSIDTLSKSQRTNKGVGPGSSFDQMAEAYPEAKCHHPAVYGPTSQLCVLVSRSGGRAIETTFAFFEKSLPLRDVEISSP